MLINNSVSKTIIKCYTCGKDKEIWKVKEKDKNFCNKACFDAYQRRNRVKTFCLFCGLPIVRSSIGTHNFCSNHCFSSWNTGGTNPACKNRSTTNIDFFKEINTEEKAYWLGFILADGCVHSDLRGISIGLAIKDYDHLLKLSNIFNAPLHKTSTKVTFKLASRQTCQDLLNIGVMPRKSLSDNLEIFNHVPTMLLPNFIRGFFDGDGCVTRCSGSIYFSFCGGKVFLEKVEDILKSIGINNGNYYNNKGCFTIRWGGVKKATLFGNWLYTDATTYLPRKYNVFLNHGLFI